MNQSNFLGKIELSEIRFKSLNGENKMALFLGSYEHIVIYTFEDLLSEARENLVEVNLATVVEGECHNLLAQYMASMITQSQ